MVLSTRAKVGQEFYFKVISKYWTGPLYWITAIDCGLFILYFHPISCLCWSLFVASHCTCWIAVITDILGNKTCGYAVFAQGSPKEGTHYR